jgi:hypothetical protein
MNNKLLRVLALILLLGILYCCTDDRDSISASGLEKTVIFSVRVPGAGAPKTYALAEGDENEVKTIEILLFDGDGKYTYQPIYSNSIATDGGDSNLKTFTVKVPEGTYDMAVLANSRASLVSALGSINTGEAKASVLEKLLLTNTGMWNADPHVG